MTMFTDNSLQARYRIIESDIGPLISESRCTVFDVMMLYDAGEAPVSYTHLDVYKRQAIGCTKKTIKENAKSYMLIAKSKIK